MQVNSISSIYSKTPTFKGIDKWFSKGTPSLESMSEKVAKFVDKSTKYLESQSMKEANPSLDAFVPKITAMNETVQKMQNSTQPLSNEAIGEFAGNLTDLCKDVFTYMQEDAARTAGKDAKKLTKIMGSVSDMLDKLGKKIHDNEELTPREQTKIMHQATRTIKDLMTTKSAQEALEEIKNFDKMG